MKKKLIKTLLIGATIGATISGFASSSVDACRLTRYETLAFTDSPSRVKIVVTEEGELYKQYKSADYTHTFYDYHQLCDKDEVIDLYCVGSDGKRVSGFLRNQGDCYWFEKGKAISGKRWISGRLYDFDKYTHKGKIIG